MHKNDIAVKIAIILINALRHLKITTLFPFFAKLYILRCANRNNESTNILINQININS